MFVKVLVFLTLLFLVHCNQGKVDLQRCGCEDSNRRQILVQAYLDRERMGDFLRSIVDLEQGGGFGGNYDPLRVEGVCLELETRRVVFCAEDRRDYEVLREEFSDVRFDELPID